MNGLGVSETPEIKIPKKEQEKIDEINGYLKSIEGKVRASEGGEVPTLNSSSILAILVGEADLTPEARKQFFENPDDYVVWKSGEGKYAYDFKSHVPKVSGGSDTKRAQAQEIFDSYFGDQFRVGSISLTNRNNASDNIVEWEAGHSRYLKGDAYPWSIYPALIHELTHAGIPLNFAKKGKDKMILLPYGLERTVDFVKMWTNAMDQEYDFFKLRFFKAEGDQTLDKLRKGGIGFGLALSEMVAMLSADYVIPPFDMAMQILEGYNEPLAKFPLTEKAIRRTIAMVHYGIERSDNYPDGVPPRDVYFKGTFSGDLFWKIYNFAISDVQNPTP